MSTDDQAKFEWRPFGWPLPRVVLIGLIGALVVAVVVVGSTSTVGFSPYNLEWDGTGEFRELADENGELVVGTTTERYETVEPPTTTAVVLAPTEQYDSEDATRVQQFVESGGTLVVADNYGPHGNELLADLGATTRFDGRVLRDDRHNTGVSALPIATNMSSHPFVRDVEQLSFNYGTALEAGESTPIVNSSSFSSLDGNYTDGESQPTDSDRRQYPVVTVESLGDGTVVVIGDPSVFINSMLDEPDNRAFAERIAGHRTTTLFDQSHTSSPPVIVSVLLAVRTSPLVAAGSLVVAISAVLFVGSQHRKRIREPIRRAVSAVRSRVNPIAPTATADRKAAQQPQPLADREALKAQLRKQHPDWDDERIERVIRGVISHQSDEPNNE